MFITRSLLPLLLAILSGRDKAQVSAGLSYEVWGSDQSNSVRDVASPGVQGSFLWIWDSASIKHQLEGGQDAVPLSCTPNEETGPCNLLDIFPDSLTQYDQDGNVLGTLGDLTDKFGRLHGVIADPYNRYVTANIFTPSGGYVGVIDTETKGAIGLFRVGATSANGVQRSVHMSIWTEDGSAIIVANLHGKMIERINVERNGNKGDIVNLQFDQSASVYLGKNFNLIEGATYFGGENAFGNELIGEVIGSYDDADTDDLTPAGVCKEGGCNSGSDNQGGVRTNNVPICPITSLSNNGYITMGSGGLFVLKLDQTPMAIIGEYGNAVVNGAGCGGAEANGRMFLNGGASASGAGATQSTFTLYAFKDARYQLGAAPVQNLPSPIQVFKDPTNTNTIGNVDNVASENNSGQLPSSTTRRDSHGAEITVDGKYIHVADRIQNVMEVFDTVSLERVNTYDLVSLTGKTGRAGPAAACLASSVLDDAELQRNDPAPDLFDVTPDGKYLMVALRGPKPVSVSHAAQGSCPGVGIVEITEDGKAGKLVGVLRSSNTLDTVPVGTITGGHDYVGAERSDVHGAIVVTRGRENGQSD
mmetsp:Transcript_27566/g.58252  ORF Transcript_27566/g.58252 Transcript_27566/m.58252 type:complete len:588 (+) Transcript_27566:103-1866(+)|eukprot:CAMPEP_0183737970 /NCGR_PEP_ID=MMETSP0737-20130205/53534_1 /TAXON_ID=385413 /ORGANISM="Thalassiosira miniscula, Strain CCMP1093" /LENGTH=587 /DNA_ID=CAMNT_0025972399 /DNA_START=90 /DNA_END=1853 /DNA_ORIENTATION=+